MFPKSNAWATLAAMAPPTQSAATDSLEIVVFRITVLSPLAILKSRTSSSCASRRAGAARPVFSGLCKQETLLENYRLTMPQAVSPGAVTVHPDTVVLITTQFPAEHFILQCVQTLYQSATSCFYNELKNTSADLLQRSSFVVAVGAALKLLNFQGVGGGCRRCNRPATHSTHCNSAALQAGEFPQRCTTAPAIVYAAVFVASPVPGADGVPQAASATNAVYYTM